MLSPIVVHFGRTSPRVKHAGLSIYLQPHRLGVSGISERYRVWYWTYYREQRRIVSKLGRRHRP